MRVLVTGISGLVGGAIARQLAARHDVVGLSRRAPEADMEHVSVDLGAGGAADAVVGMTKPCDAIIHAAALVTADPFAEAIARVNCGGTIEMAKLASRWECRRLVFISSVPVIGTPTTLPITEDHPTAPQTTYHASKLFGEQVLATHAAELSSTSIALRLTSPVGPGMPRNRILATYVARAIKGEALDVAGRGTRRQDYIDIRDIGTAVELALGSGAAGVFNIARGESIANVELAERCVAVLDSSSEIRVGSLPDPSDDVRWEVSIGRAQDELGFRPRHDIDDSIMAVAADIDN